MKDFIVAFVVTAFFCFLLNGFFKLMGGTLPNMDFLLGWFSCYIFNYSLKYLENEK